MHIVAFLIALLLGLFMLIKPRMIWNMHNALFVKDGEPSNFYFALVRCTGAVVIIIVVVLGVVGFLSVNRGHISGDELFDQIPMENVTQITVQKTRENSASIEELGSFELTQSQIEQFYRIFSDTQLKDIGQRSFAINTEIRYFVFFLNSEGNADGTMKFYENEALILDYAYGDRPAIHKRYSIISSSLNDFFESIVLQEMIINK